MLFRLVMDGTHLVDAIADTTYTSHRDFEIQVSLIIHRSIAGHNPYNLEHFAMFVVKSIHMVRFMDLSILSVNFENFALTLEVHFVGKFENKTTIIYISLMSPLQVL